MNITINRMEMLDTARRMASIAPADSPLDVLHGVLLEADAGSGRLALTATSLELALMEQLPCTAVESGTFAIDAQMLTGMVEKLPEDTVEIIHPEGGAAVTLRSGCAHYTVPIWPRSSFPLRSSASVSRSCLSARIPAGCLPVCWSTGRMSLPPCRAAITRCPPCMRI